MQAPRGMVLRDGLLYIAESSANDPGVAVFGNCSTEEGAAAAAADAGVSSLPSWQLYQRPYLGKIRPAPHIGLPPFQHPYGLVEMGASARVALSAQNGGAAISLDLDDGEMACLQQVEPPMSRSSNREKLSGPLRGLAVDGAGCLHVAERHLDEIVHYCPADGKEVGRTKVTSPIDVKVDMRENELLVGSFSKTHPQVLAFSLKDLHDEYHASHGRRAQDAATDAARYRGEAQEERRQVRQAEGGADVCRPAARPPGGDGRVDSEAVRPRAEGARAPPLRPEDHQVRGRRDRGPPRRPGAPADQRRVLNQKEPFSISLDTLTIIRPPEGTCRRIRCVVCGDTGGGSPLQADLLEEKGDAERDHPAHREEGDEVARKHPGARHARRRLRRARPAAAHAASRAGTRRRARRSRARCARAACGGEEEGRGGEAVRQGGRAGAAAAAGGGAPREDAHVGERDPQVGARRAEDVGGALEAGAEVGAHDEGVAEGDGLHREREGDPRARLARRERVEEEGEDADRDEDRPLRHAEQLGVGATIHADATSESGSQMRTKMPPISMPPCTSAGLDAPE